MIFNTTLLYIHGTQANRVEYDAKQLESSNILEKINQLREQIADMLEQTELALKKCNDSVESVNWQIISIEQFTKHWSNISEQLHNIHTSHKEIIKHKENYTILIKQLIKSMHPIEISQEMLTQMYDEFTNEFKKSDQDRIILYNRFIECVEQYIDNTCQNNIDFQNFHDFIKEKESELMQLFSKIEPLFSKMHEVYGAIIAILNTHKETAPKRPFINQFGAPINQINEQLANRVNERDKKMMQANKLKYNILDCVHMIDQAYCNLSDTTQQLVDMSGKYKQLTGNITLRLTKIQQHDDECNKEDTYIDNLFDNNLTDSNSIKTAYYETNSNDDSARKCVLNQSFDLSEQIYRSLECCASIRNNNKICDIVDDMQN